MWLSGRVLAGGALCAGLALAGCVERKLFVRADVEGARVYMDGEPRGTTPCEVPFTFYGTREVVVRAPGREVAREVVTLTPPWYQVAPFDFVVEVLWPGTIEDVHEVTVTLPPLPKASEASLDALSARGEAYRAGVTATAVPVAVSGTANQDGGGRKGGGR